MIHADCEWFVMIRFSCDIIICCRDYIYAFGLIYRELQLKIEIIVKRPRINSWLVIQQRRTRLMGSPWFARTVCHNIIKTIIWIVLIGSVKLRYWPFYPYPSKKLHCPRVYWSNAILCCIWRNAHCHPSHADHNDDDVFVMNNAVPVIISCTITL